MSGSDPGMSVADMPVRGGLGVDRDLIQSYAWFSAAAAQGDDNALRKRKETARLLSAEELNEAKALAVSFKQRYRRPDPDQKAAAGDGAF